MKIFNVYFVFSLYNIYLKLLQIHTHPNNNSSVLFLSNYHVIRMQSEKNMRENQLIIEKMESSN